MLNIISPLAIVLALITPTTHKEYIHVSQKQIINQSTIRTVQPNHWKPSWLAELRKPHNSYWDKVAQCETASNWQDRGVWAGGLGIYIKTWRGFGGQEFAPKQWLATRLEQIVVANRIALHGWSAPNGYFQQPVGFLGWGCIRNNTYLTPTVPSPWGAWSQNVASLAVRPAKGL